MSKFKLSKVNTLPQTPDPSTIYLRKSPNGEMVELFFSNKEGTQIFPGITEQYVIDKIAEYADTGFSSMEIVADIAARDALTPSRNTFVMVLDATGDDTVETGSALYLYGATAHTYYKVAEYDAIDLATTWDSVQGRPASSPTDIDAAVNGYLTLGRLSLSEDGAIMVDGEVKANVTLVTTNW